MEIYTCQRMSSYRFLKRYPKDKLVMFNNYRRNQFKKKLTKYSEDIDDIFERSIEDIIDELPNEDIAYKRLSLLIKLGLAI